MTRMTSDVYAEWEDEALLHEFASLSITCFAGKYDEKSGACQAARHEILRRMRGGRPPER